MSRTEKAIIIAGLIELDKSTGVYDSAIDYPVLADIVLEYRKKKQEKELLMSDEYNFKVGDKIYIEATVNKKIETGIETYYEASIPEHAFGGQYRQSLTIEIRKFNKIKT